MNILIIICLAIIFLWIIRIRYGILTLAENQQQISNNITSSHRIILEEIRNLQNENRR